MSDDLVARARERSEASPIPEGWGYRVALDEGESFVGRWRGETVDELNDNRRVFLLWDESDEPCFSRTYAALSREIDRVQPTVGCTIAIFRGDDYIGKQGSGYSFGAETEANDKPLPADPAGAGGEPDADVPF